MASPKVELLITAKNLAGRVIDDVRGSFERLGKSLATVGTLGGVLAFEGVKAALRGVFEEADQAEAALRRLDATAQKLGVSSTALRQFARNAQEGFALADEVAGPLVASLTELAYRAGDASKATALLPAVLDLAAAKGMTASDATAALEGALRGTTKQLAALIGEKPAEAFARMAEGGIDASNAQKVLNLLMADGAKVTGAAARELREAAGRTRQFHEAVNDLKKATADLLNPLREVAVWLATKFVNLGTASVQGWRLIFTEIGEGVRRIPAWFLSVFAQVLDDAAGWADKFREIGENIGLHMGDGFIRSLRVAASEFRTKATDLFTASDVRLADSLAGASAGALSGGAAPGGSGAALPTLRRPTAGIGTVSTTASGPLSPTRPTFGGSPLAEALDPALLEQIDKAAASAQSAMQPLQSQISGTASAFGELGAATKNAFAAMVAGSISAGRAFEASVLSALAKVAEQEAAYYFARAAASFAGGDFAGGAGFVAAGLGMEAVAGVTAGYAAKIGGGAGGGYGAPGSFTGGAGFMNGVGTLDEATPTTIVINGGLLDMTDPRQADALASALNNLKGRRVILQGAT